MMLPDAGQQPPVPQDEVVLETPERVELRFELAGIGSRFLAAFIDSLIQGTVIFLLALGAGLAGASVSGLGEEMVFAAIVLVLSSMLIVIIYYIAFEMRWGGQTPGKRVAGLTVVRDDGSPIDFTASAIRNILRLADILPIYYTVGIVTILVTKHCKRLGDIAAGTIVVKVRGQKLPDLVESDPAEQVPPTSHSPVDDVLVQRAMPHVSFVSQQEADTVSRFLARRAELEPTSRRSVALRIAAGLRGKFPALSEQDVPDPEVFLSIVHKALSHAHRK